MTHITRRRRLLLFAVGGAVVFLGITAAVALRRSQSTTTYRPGEQLDEITSDLSRPLPADYPRVTFTDATRPAGIDFRHFDGRRASWLPEDMGSGAAWGDFDGDGWVDLAVTNEVGSIDMTEADRRRSPARTV